METLKKTSEYEDLKELNFSSMGITYGPLQSRRLGLSLGINLLGSENKICSFDCPYCELGYTRLKMSEMKKFEKYPSLEAIDSHVRQHLLILSKQNTTFNYITISGNGEPTLYPEFPEAVSLLIKIRDELCPESKLVVMTNGSTLDGSKIIRALNNLDERMIKLDAGNDEMLKRIGAPLVRMTLAKLIQGAKKLKDITLQTLFVQGAIDNTTPSEVEDWVEVVGIIRPKLVHMYSLDRVPPMSGLKQVPTQRLKEIALSLQKRTNIKGIVFS
jgi:wyosine [tRNA(Phe)-imidazoG37] synthetase (radical SAM superfamily)